MKLTFIFLTSEVTKVELLIALGFFAVTVFLAIQLLKVIAGKDKKEPVKAKKKKGDKGFAHCELNDIMGYDFIEVRELYDKPSPEKEQETTEEPTEPQENKIKVELTGAPDKRDEESDEPPIPKDDLPDPMNGMGDNSKDLDNESHSNDEGEHETVEEGYTIIDNPESVAWAYGINDDQFNQHLEDSYYSGSEVYRGNPDDDYWNDKGPDLTSEKQSEKKKELENEINNDVSKFLETYDNTSDKLKKEQLGGMLD